MALQIRVLEMIQYWISHLETHLDRKSELLINYLKFSLKCHHGKGNLKY